MLFLYDILRVILYPVIRYLLPLFSQKIRKRIHFEQNNLIQVSSLKQAKYAFEVSSEGELEQVNVLIQKALEQGDTVEIIYCSESVEHKVMELRKRYPELIRSYILPVICYNPLSQKMNAKKWLTAKRFYLCRYDFFPELIGYGMKNDVEFHLVSAALKNFSQKNILERTFLKFCFSKFDKVVATSAAQKDIIAREMNISSEKLEVFDFRTLQIQSRIADRLKTLSSKISFYQELETFFKETNGSSLVLGSFWNHEMELLPLLNVTQDRIAIVPHDLKKESKVKLKQFLEDHQLPLYEISEKTSPQQWSQIQQSFSSQPGFILINIKGVLCELYSMFEKAYVGGGFHASIHSVLEPFIAGCLVFTGPNTSRSTEYAMITQYNGEVISKSQEFTELAKNIQEHPVQNYADVSSFMNHFTGHLDALLMWLGISRMPNYA